MNRRNFLRGMMGGTAVAFSLPWLESVARANDGFPKRYVQWIWGNGNRPERWIPDASGFDYMLSEQLAPLQAVKDKLVVPTGLSVLHPNAVPHKTGIGGLLTGAIVDGSNFEWAVRESTLDQRIASAFEGQTLYRSLEVGVSTPNAFSWNGPNARNPAETSPLALYERLFGPTFVPPGGEGLVDPELGFRRSALDAVLSDLNRLTNRVSVADRIRLEQHADGVRDLEFRLARLEESPPSLAACMQPDVPPSDFPDIADNRPDLQARHAVQAQLMAMALACDQTRVATLQWSEPILNVLYPDASPGHHLLTHNEQGDQPQVNAITIQIMEAFAVFLETLDAIPEGEGTLLDHCLVMGCTDVSEGQIHSLDEMPVVLAGSACGAIRTGQHVRYQQRNANALGLSILRAMDVQTASFGRDEFETSDDLSEILS